MNFEQRLEEIKNRFRARALSEAAALESDWLQAKDGHAESMIAIRERAHAISGTAATLQFDALANFARETEEAIDHADAPMKIDACITGLIRSLHEIALRG